MTPSQAASAAVLAHIALRGGSQRAIAEVLGLSQQSVSDRLTGKTPFTLADLDRLAEHWDIPVAQLLDPPASLVDDAPEVES
jgi:transcriptional regulator with XRE-family HTH domain